MRLHSRLAALETRERVALKGGRVFIRYAPGSGVEGLREDWSLDGEYTDETPTSRDTTIEIRYQDMPDRQQA